jgi:oxygen-independent coproporphyrinogen III oxidase
VSERFGAYVHVPWCRARCPYCAFAVVPERAAPDWGPFVDRILWERDHRRSQFPGRPATLFFGGGTPSRLPPAAFARLVEGLAPTEGAEISAEVNPEDASDAWLAGVTDAGVNRVSLGVQSFVPHVARWLGRGHTQRRAEAALDSVRRAGLRSFSVDLIFAVPGQALADLDVDLASIVAAEVPHVSLYGLTFEPGTRHGARKASGKTAEVDQDGWRAMYDHLVERLSAAGLHRYEVSNFARTGHRSEHNSLYWTDAPYLGLGPSAHGYLSDGTRYANHASLDTWLGAEPTAFSELPSPDARYTDLLVSGLRAAEGVDLRRLRERTRLQPEPGVVQALVAAGLVTEQEERLSLTADGFPLCDGIVERLAAHPQPASGPGSGNAPQAQRVSY